MKKIGITTTVPIEVILAAGHTPIDLNNLFVTADAPSDFIAMAEKDGFPKSMCAWIKGIYGAALYHGLDTIIGVTEGDCSNTKCLLDVFALRGITLIPFGFPHSRDKEKLKDELNKLMQAFDVSPQQVEAERLRLNAVRDKAAALDALALSGQSRGFENHLFQVCMSDLGGMGYDFSHTLDKVYETIAARPHKTPHLKLAYLGVPPMMADLYDFIETQGGLVVYNEVQNEFAFPRASQHTNIVDQYLDYTYPYDNDFRISSLKKTLADRGIDGIVHYTQAFCHRAIDDLVLKHHLDLPILNIEGDTSAYLDQRTKLRLEAFIDMLKDKKAGVTCAF